MVLEGVGDSLPRGPTPHPFTLDHVGDDRARPGRLVGFGVDCRMLTNSSGYEYIEDSDGQPAVAHHRLLAVAEHGVGAVDDDLVHHNLPVEWLNVRENMSIVTPNEHASIHADDDVVDDLAELVDDADDGRREVRE